MCNAATGDLIEYYKGFDDDRKRVVFSPDDREALLWGRKEQLLVLNAKDGGKSFSCVELKHFT